MALFTEADSVNRDADGERVTVLLTVNEELITASAIKRAPLSARCLQKYSTHKPAALGEGRSRRLNELPVRQKLHTLFSYPLRGL